MTARESRREKQKTSFERRMSQLEEENNKKEANRRRRGDNKESFEAYLERNPSIYMMKGPSYLFPSYLHLVKPMSKKRLLLA